MKPAGRDLPGNGCRCAHRPLIIPAAVRAKGAGRSPAPSLSNGKGRKLGGRFQVKIYPNVSTGRRPHRPDAGDGAVRFVPGR